MRARWFTLATLGVALMAAPVVGMAAGPAAAQGQEAKAPSQPLDLNTATAEALLAIPGIGTVMAERIVQWREEHGPFQSVDDLMKVKGIGEKSLEKLRPYVKVGKTR
jgi:competence protein ComEA